MTKPTPQNILSILERLDWTGHVEISFNDMVWVANELAAKLSPRSGQMCDACETLREIVIDTPLGSICELCLKDAHEEAEQTREMMED